MSKSIDDRTADLVKQADAGNWVRVTKEVVELLLQNDIAHVMRLPPGMVGIHSENRDGLGCNGHDVHQLAVDIYDLGWDESQINAICAEANDDQRRWTVALMSSNRDTLPPYTSPETIRYVSLSASHTNQMLRCINGHMSHFDPRLCVDGKLNAQKIGMHDEAMASACTKGLKWTIIPDRVLAKHPQLAGIIQSGMNAASQVARQESEIQVLRKIHTYWKQEFAKCGPNDKVNFDIVRRLVVRSKPPCAASLMQMYQFVLKASGGADAKFLTETETFLRTHLASSKSLGADMYAALAKDLPQSMDQLIHLRHALMKLAFCKHCSPAEVRRCLSKGDDTGHAEKLLASVRKILGEAVPPPYDVKIISALGLFDIEVVAKLISKSVHSYDFIAHRCIEQMSNDLSCALPNPFSLPAAKEIQEAANKQDVSQPSKSTSDPCMCVSQMVLICVEMESGSYCACLTS
jgi:hypothetical protein